MAANQDRVLHHPRALVSGGVPFLALGSSRFATAYLNKCGPTPPPPTSSAHSSTSSKKCSQKVLTKRDQDLRGQFLGGLFDFRLEQKCYEDEPDRNFCEVFYRAQELELIQKNSEERRRPLH